VAALKKGYLRRRICKFNHDLACGSHGTPLQKLLTPIINDVGEEGGLLTASKSLCPPAKINRFDILRYYSINPVVSGEPYIL